MAQRPQGSQDALQRLRTSLGKERKETTGGVGTSAFKYSHGTFPKLLKTPCRLFYEYDMIDIQGVSVEKVYINSAWSLTGMVF